MVKVRFKTRSAGPKGQIAPGQVVSVPEGEAKLLVKGGYAEYAGKEPAAGGGGADAPPAAPKAGEKDAVQGDGLVEAMHEDGTAASIEPEAGEKDAVQGDGAPGRGAHKPGGRKTVPADAAG